jgi:hypothetical protein
MSRNFHYLGTPWWYRALGGRQFNWHLKKELQTFRAIDFFKNKINIYLIIAGLVKVLWYTYFVPYSSNLLWMVFSFVALYWFVESLSWGGLLLCFWYCLKALKKVRCTIVILQISKPMEQKVINFNFNFCNQSLPLYHNWLFNLPFSHLKC